MEALVFSYPLEFLIRVSDKKFNHLMISRCSILPPERAECGKNSEEAKLKLSKQIYHNSDDRNMFHACEKSCFSPNQKKSETQKEKKKQSLLQQKNVDKFLCDTSMR